MDYAAIRFIVAHYAAQLTKKRESSSKTIDLLTFWANSLRGTEDNQKRESVLTVGYMNELCCYTFYGCAVRVRR